MQSCEMWSTSGRLGRKASYSFTFSAEITASLTKGILNSKARDDIIISLARAMLVHTMYISNAHQLQHHLQEACRETFSKIALEVAT